MTNKWNSIQDIEEAKKKICSRYVGNKKFTANFDLVTLVRGPIVLDFGGGIGRNTSLLVNLGHDVYFYDYSNMVELAKQNIDSDLIENIFWLEYGKIDLKDFYFDSVLASLVFQHIPKLELEQILQELNCDQLVMHSRGYLDDHKHNIWPIVLKEFTPITELDAEAGTEKHQIVIFKKRI